MVRAPVRVPVKGYSGSNPKLREKFYERIELSKKLSDYINSRVKDDGVEVFVYASIAHELGLSTKEVTECLFALDCGHAGITVYGKNYTPPKL